VTQNTRMGAEDDVGGRIEKNSRKVCEAMDKNNPVMSVVVPVYGCEACLKELSKRLQATLEKITSDYEFIFINDASPDGAWETIIKLNQSNLNMKGLNLSRNFGQHHAITAGLDFASGDWVI